MIQTTTRGVVVLGMSRSGTSAVTNMFAAAGFFVGAEEDLMPAAESNAAGHWENLRIWRQHEEILSRLGGNWLEPPAAEGVMAAQDWATGSLRLEVDRIVAQAAGAPVAIKDPRIAILLPLWQPLIEDWLHPVLVVRDPIEIAASLMRRNGTPPPLALAAWELHLAAVLEYLNGRQVVIAPYADLLARPELAEQIVAEAAAYLDPGHAAHVHPSAASEALQVRLRHNRAGDGNHEELLTARQLELRRWLASLPAGECRLEVPPKLLGPRPTALSNVRFESERLRQADELHDAREQVARQETELATLGASLRTEQDRTEALQAELATTQHAAKEAVAARQRAEATYRDLLDSVSWRMTVPLRAAKAAALRVAHPGRKG